LHVERVQKKEGRLATRRTIIGSYICSFYKVARAPELAINLTRGPGETDHAAYASICIGRVN